MSRLPRTFAEVSASAWTRLLLGLTFLAYLPIINYSFVYDDRLLILLNPWMTTWAAARQLVTHHMWAFATGSGYHPADFYRPVFMLWLLTLNRLGHGTPGFFHVANLVLHLIAILLAIEIARRVTDLRTSLFAGALFALDPIHVEAVAWISGGTELLCSVFVLGSVLAYLKSAESHPSAWITASVLLFGIALFSKETAIVTPVAILAHHVATSPKSPSNRLRGATSLMAPYVVMSAAYFAVRIRVLGSLKESRFSGPGSALLGFPLRLAWYLKQLLWPFHLSVSYRALDAAQLPNTLTIPLFVLFAALTATIVWKVRRSPAWALIGTLSFLSLCPVLLETFTGFQDRYLYLPSLGFCVLIAAAIGHSENAKLRISVTTALLVIFTVGTLCEERVWNNDPMLFRRALEVNPSPKNYAQLSAAYRIQNASQPELATLQQGLQRYPQSDLLWSRLGDYYETRGELNAAASAFQTAQKNSLSEADRAANDCALGIVDFERHNFAAALPELRAGLASNPQYKECRNTLDLLMKISGSQAQPEKTSHPELPHSP